jgi:hypothetical protein
MLKTVPSVWLAAKNTFSPLKVNVVLLFLFFHMIIKIHRVITMFSFHVAKVGNAPDRGC